MTTRAAIAGAILALFLGVPESHLLRAIPVDPSKSFISEVPAVVPSFPFQVGETLDYRLTWSMFSNAATVRMQVVEQRDFFGTPTWHFRASVHSQIPLRSFAIVDDQFDSYAEMATLDSKQYETYLDELGEKQTAITRLVAPGEPRPTRSTMHSTILLVKAHTRDPLAALYALRAFDWRHASELRGPVWDGEDLYEMRANLEAADEAIQVAGREERATRILVRLFRGGADSRTRCSIWFSQDAARVPLVMDAQVPYGRVRAELLSKHE
ncbi:MAG TPA: DUF3108 domain-containing protein [Candidatus Acidoferrales bacterium]